MIEVDAGSLSLNGGGTSTGTVNVASGAVLNFAAGTYALSNLTAQSGTGQLLVNGGTVNTTGANAFSGQLAITSGTLNVPGSFTPATFAMSGGTLAGAGTLTVAGASSWGDGTMSGTGSTTFNGPLALTGSTYNGNTGSSSRTISGRTVNFAGTTTWTGTNTANAFAAINANAGAVLNNTGTWLDQTTGPTFIINQGGAASSFNNSGSYVKSIANANTTFGIAFNNPGTVDVQAGTLTATLGIIGPSGTLRTGTGGTLTLGAASTTGILSNNANLVLGTNNLTVSTDYNNANFGTGNSFVKHANVTGTGQILAAGNVAQAITGATVVNGSSANPTLVITNVRTGTTSYTYQVANTGTSGPSLRGAIETGVNGGHITDSRLSGSGVTGGNYGPIATGSSSGNYTVTFTNANAGALLSLSNQSVHIANNFDNVGEQTLNIILGAGASAYNAAVGNATPSPASLGNVRVGGALAQTFTVSNTQTPGSFSEDLNASFGPSTGGATATGSIAGLLAGASNNTAMRASLGTTTAGAKTGTVTINYDTAGTVNGVSNGLGVANVGSQTIALSGNVYNTAVGSVAPTSVTIANQRVGGNGISALTVGNTAPTGAFSEALNAGFGGSTGSAITNGAGVGNLIAGGTSTNLGVGVSTATSGAKTGTVTIAYQSDGTGPNGNSGLAAIAAGSQTVNVSGNVYQAAAGTILTAPLNFGTVQVGQVVSQNLSIQNSATGTAGFVEDLNASFGASTGTGATRITGSGSITGLIAGATGSGLTVGVNTGSAGIVNGSIAVNFVSAGAVGGVSNGLGTLAVGSSNYGVSGTIQGNVVDQAAPVINNSPIALGNVRVGAASPTGSVSVTNQATGNQQAALNAGIVGNAPITASGSFALLNPGATNNASLSVGMNTATAGSKNGTATISFVSDASNIGGCGNACQLALPSQQVAVTGGVYQIAQASIPTSINLGNVHVGSASSQALSIGNVNVAPIGFQEGLDVGVGTTSANLIAGGSIVNLGAGATSTGINVGLSSTAAGLQSGNLVLNLASNGATTSGLSTLGLGTASVAVSATGYNLASGSVAPTPVTLANQRVGGNASQVLAVSNTAASGAFTEGLNASFGGNGGAVLNNGGSVGLLAGQATNNSAMTVRIDTSSAGAKSGTATVNFVSDGSGTSGLGLTNVGSQTIAVSGNVYGMAIGQATPSPLTIANQRVGGSGSAALTISNTAASGGFSEALNASFGGIGGAVTTNNGSVTNLAAGGSNNTAMSVGVNTATAGAKTGSVTIAYQSDGTGPNGNSGLAAVGAGTQTVGVGGNVYQTAAGTLLTAPLNFGTVQVGQSVLQSLTVQNSATGAAGFVEDLNARFGATSGTNGNLIAGTGTVSGLVAGATSNGLTVQVNTSAAGLVNGSIGVNFFSAGSVAGVGNGLGELAVGSANYGVSGTIQTSGNVVDQALPVINNGPIALGNVRIGSTSPTGLVSVTNQATGNQQAALNASIAGNAPVTASGSFSLLAPGATNGTSLAVGFDTSTAGAKNGTATVSFVSDASNIGGCGNACQLTLGSQSVAVTGAVYRLANPTVVPNTITVAGRVGSAAPTTVINVTNSSPDLYTEGLTVSRGATSSGFASSGGIVNLAAGGSSGAIGVTLNTTAAGTFSGTQALNYVSTGAGTTGAADLAIGSGSVALSGKVYTPAVAAINTPSVAFGIVHVGDSVSQGVSVTNAAASTALNDVLVASASGATGPFTAGGSLAGLAAQQTSSALTVGLNTATAGVYSGSASFSAASHDADLSDAALANLVIGLSGQVNNYASDAFRFASGAGALTQSGSTYFLDYGTVSKGSGTLATTLLAANSATGPADLLDGSFQFLDAADFDEAGFADFIGLAAGQGTGALTLAFDPTTLGSFIDTIVLHGFGHNASGYSGAIGDIQLIVRGNVTGQVVPEPDSLLLLALGIPLLLLRRGHGRRASSHTH